MHINNVAPNDLADYAKIPISFEVGSRFDITSEPGSFEIIEQQVDEVWLKDYDAHESPAALANRFDLQNWGILLACEADAPIGGCIIAHNSADVDMLRGRSDLAVLWDIRVVPESRGSGLGKQLFTAAINWAKDRGCTEMHIETQNINVPACKFYQRMGCHLHSVERNAYAACPGEDRLIWAIDLRS